MGLFKQLKDMKHVVAQAPSMISQAQQTAAAAQAYSVQQHQLYGAQGGYTAANASGAPTNSGIDPADPRLAPIAGVDLTLFARISKAAALEGLDVNGLLIKAQSYGVVPEAWQEAATGWPTRMRGDTQLAVHYGNLFGQVQP